MLYVTKTAVGISMYTVTNEQGDVLIYTTDAKMARFVNDRTLGVDRELRLRVGGDQGTHIKNPLWTHVRRFSKK